MVANQAVRPAEPTDALRKDIRLLAGLLGKVIQEQHGASAFEMVEHIRQLAKARRNGDTDVTEELVSTLDSLTLGSKHILIKAFTNYFQLINIAEDQQRIRVLRRRESEGRLDESIESAIRSLREQGVGAAEIRELISRLNIRLVLTAHPTEAKRREILIKLRHIAHLMFQKDVQALLPRELEAIEQSLLAEIEGMWQTRITRATRATVEDEMEFGLYFLASTIMDVSVAIYEELVRSLTVCYPDENWEDIPPVLTYASWVGGDRDGNPNVTPAVTLDVLAAMRASARNVYLDEIAILRDELTQSIEEVGVSSQLLASIADAGIEKDQYPGELYRQHLDLIWHRLHNDLYRRSIDLLDDLHLAQASLIQNRGRYVARGHFGRLIHRVRLFGLHLAPLEIRDDARRHAAALAEAFARYGICADYLACTEEEKQALLTEEIANPRPLFPSEPDFSDETNTVVATWQMIAEAHRLFGERCIDTAIASMSAAPSDMLAMLLLATKVGVQDYLDLVPLFETIDELWAASEIMATVFANPAYRAHLEKRQNHQQIMIGYSDSSKDGGLFASAWGLYAAQQAIAEMCLQHGISLELFHGRGGSIGRGGGPTGRAIQSQPPASIQGRVKITEQGEVIAFRYSNPEIARRHLHQVIHAALLATWAHPDDTIQPEWRAMMDCLSEQSRRAYRSLVYETPEFMDYWQQATPINELAQLNIGSRPAKRSAGGFSAVRAIPWVFSWMQSRALIPSWYGLGTAIENCCAGGTADLPTLQAMYKDWPFFNLLLANVELDIVKADMGIAGQYASLVEDEAIRTRIFGLITAEHARVTHWVCAVTGQESLLDYIPTIKASIASRNPYIDPLSFIQVGLLRDLRSLESHSVQYQVILRAVLATINGIAAGMKNTG